MIELYFMFGAFVGIFAMCILELVCYAIDYIKLKTEKEKGVKK